MNTELRALVREGILVSLYKSGSYRPTLAVLFIQLTRAGHAIGSQEEVTRELGYLIDKGFVAEERPVVSPELRQYRITAAGSDYLAERGLA